MSAYAKHLAKITAQLGEGEEILASTDASREVPAVGKKGKTMRFGALAATSTRLIYSGSFGLAAEFRTTPWHQITGLEMESALNAHLVVTTAADAARYLVSGHADALISTAHEQLARR